MSSTTKNPLTVSRHSRMRGASRWAAALALGLTLGVSSVALAGEIKLGTEALAVDGEGKLTDAGRAAAKDEIPSEPGKETWVVHLWAKLDKPAPGGLNIEFHGTLPDGKSYLAYSEAEEGFDGGKYLSMELELEGSKGFNKNKSYTIHITQQDDKGREFKLASGKIKLGWTEAPKEPEPAAEGGGDGEEVDSSAQDALDTLSGGGDGGGEGGDGAGAASGGPPPVDKKGCAIDADAGGTLALLGLFALAATSSARRRRKPDATL